MNRTEILQFINAHPACSLATVEGNQPRVRGMLVYKADAKGLVFHTGTGKSLYKQVQANPRVEVVFNDFETRTQVRVEGVVEILDDLALKKEIAEARPFMKPWVEQFGYGFIGVFRVTRCKVAVWTMAANLEPTTYQDL
jgi:pyridoxamine 5'-phosphate oxidase